MAESLFERLASLGERERDALLASLDDETLAQVMSDWRFLARPEQLEPSGEWLYWLFSAGRGAGKTRSASEWIHERHIRFFELTNGVRAHRAFLAGRAAPDVRDVMIEGESGVLAIAERRGLTAKYEPSKRRVVWPDLHGVATTFTAEEPDQGRGPEFHSGWADEFATWDFTKTDSVGNNLHTNLKMALRLAVPGFLPRAMYTTTPKKIPQVREMWKAGEDPDDLSTVITNAGTMANAANLSRAFLDEVSKRYAGTSLATQELEGLLLTDVEGALWTEAVCDRAFQAGRPFMLETGFLERACIAVDPPTGKNRDECGIVAVGLLKPPHDLEIHNGRMMRRAIVLDDRSRGGSPESWARAAVDLALAWGITDIVAESNQGGEMVRSLIANADNTGLIRIHLVHASLGKRARAEPVAQLYEQDRVAHLLEMPELVDQLCSWTPNDKDSPDRLDALVHGITWLIPDLNRRPAVATGTASKSIASVTRTANSRLANRTRLDYIPGGGSRGGIRRAMNTRR